MSINEQEQREAMSKAAKMAKAFDPREAKSFLSRHADKDWAADFAILLRMLTTKGYRLNPSTWAIIAGALAYAVLPFDVIPDIIPGIG